jgi:nucleotide-binding universal stress UspA family protein
VVELLGTRIGRLTLAGVVSFDITSRQAVDNAKRAVQLLEESAASTHPHEPGTVLLTGEPAGALTRHASEEAYDLLVIGRRGRGASKAILGSTASRAPVGTDLPVLIV